MVKRKNRRNDKLSRAKHRRLQRQRRLVPQLEVLESRLLLIADPFYTATSAIDVTLKIEEVSGVDTLRLLDTSNDTVLASETLSNVDKAVRIVGSNFGDTFRLEIDTATVTAKPPPKSRDSTGKNGRLEIKVATPLLAL